jgi:methionyl-tRNA formyltransferase
MNSTRVVYFGQSFTLFDWLLLQENIEVLKVFVPAVDQKRCSEWMTRCALAGIHLIQNAKPNELLNHLPINLDLALCAHFDVIPTPVLRRFRLGVVNIHPAPLPMYPGRYPLIDLCLSGSSLGGVSLHWMSEEVDQGDLIAVDHFVSHPLEGPIELEVRAEKRACLLLSEHWHGIINGYAPRQLQVKKPRFTANRLIPCPTSFIDVETLLRALNTYGPYGGMGLFLASHNSIIRVIKATLMPANEQELLTMDSVEIMEKESKGFSIQKVLVHDEDRATFYVSPTWVLSFPSQMCTDLRNSGYLFCWEVRGIKDLGKDLATLDKVCGSLLNPLSSNMKLSLS